MFSVKEVKYKPTCGIITTKKFSTVLTDFSVGTVSVRRKAVFSIIFSISNRIYITKDRDSDFSLNLGLLWTVFFTAPFYLCYSISRFQS